MLRGLGQQPYACESLTTDTALASVLALREIDPRSRAFVLSTVYRQGPGLLAAPTGRLRRIADLRRQLHGPEHDEASLQARRVQVARYHALTGMANPAAAPVFGHIGNAAESRRKGGRGSHA